jgi:hypothetical protein
MAHRLPKLTMITSTIGFQSINMAYEIRLNMAYEIRPWNQCAPLKDGI